MINTPNSKFQVWIQMLFCFFIMMVPLFYYVMKFTWSIGESESWGSFALHSPPLMDTFFLVVPMQDPVVWFEYWNVLGEQELRYKFTIHTIFPFVLSIAISFYLTKKLLWVEGGREFCVHIKGPKLYIGRNAIKHAAISQKEDINRDKRAVKGVNIHPKININTSREQTNFLLLGTTGSGKSTVVKPMLNSIINRGDYAFIYDEKKEYTRSFYIQNTTVLIAPWDARSDQWNISSDILNKQDAYLVANCLIPLDKSKDGMWVKGARLIFVGMLVSLISQRKPWGWFEIAELLSLPQEDMLKKLKRYFPIANSFIVENSKTTQGFYVNIISELSWLEELAKAWPRVDGGRFSIKKWVNQQSNKKVIIIQSDSRFEVIGSPLCNALISLMTRYYLAQPDNNSKKTWLVIDEAANLPVNPMLIKWLELARSKGARSIISTQSLSRLVELYSKNNTDAMLNLLSTVISLRIGPAGDDAKQTARIFGDRIVERPSSLEPNSNWQRCKESIIEDFELTQLPPAGWRGVNGYLFVPGWNATYKLQWPLYTISELSEEHIPAKWLVEKIIKTKVSKNRLTNRIRNVNGQSSK